MKLAQFRQKLPGIGLRKVKSIIAVAIAFVIWQLVRWIVSPALEVHPVFGYVYAVVELRETPEKTKAFSIYRLKATAIGLALGLLTLPLSVWFETAIANTFLLHIADLALILVGVLISLWVADLCKCKNLCGIAAIIFILCIIRDRNSSVSIYMYAILRAVETLVGVLAAWFANAFFFRHHIKKSGQTPQ